MKELIGGSRALVLMVVLVVAYTLGYMLRLFSPDRLDAISGKRVLQSMSREEREVWPYTGCPQDKFPYFHTREYLQARNLSDVALRVRLAERGLVTTAELCMRLGVGRDTVAAWRRSGHLRGRASRRNGHWLYEVPDPTTIATLLRLQRSGKRPLRGHDATTPA
ncbi:MAG: helix-turn-helix domain-containing protein [Planctomycetota bacterium]